MPRHCADDSSADVIARPWTGYGRLVTWLDDTRDSYDAIAASYADETRDLLDRQLYVRAGVVLFAELVRAIGGGPVADVGCGPGHTTALLRELGVDAFGMDLSPAMIEIARREHSAARFEVGSMTDLDLADESLAGVIAWWSLIHIPDHAVPGVVGQFRRVLRPGGVLAVGFHVGEEPSGDVHYRAPSRVADWLREGGFTVEAQHLLRPDDPIPGAIVFARRPEAPR